MVCKNNSRRLIAHGNRRGAFSLIEVITAIAAGAAITAVAVGMIYTLLEFESATRENLGRRTAIANLADVFRRDVRAANRLTLPQPASGADQPPAWKLELEATRVVEYRIDESHLVRIERSGEKLLGSESFSLPKRATASIEPPTEEEPAIVSLRIRADTDESDVSSWTSLRVDAQLAKDRRFLQRE